MKFYFIIENFKFLCVNVLINILLNTEYRKSDQFFVVETIILVLME